MEFLNRIELRGIVGSVKVMNFEGKSVINVHLATSRAYKGQEGDGIIETTWHNVTAWEGRNICDFSLIEKGSKLHVMGRIRNQKYTGSDGIDRTAIDVMATRLTIIDSDEPLAYEP